MKMPLVSIGLPTYNRASDLDACLANLTKLNYKNIEIIISDNNSSDNTKNVCNVFCQKDKRIRYYRQKINIGVHKNSNFVLAKATGKYFFWASDDDFRSEQYISKLVPLLEKNPQATLAITDTKLFTKDQSAQIPIFLKSNSHAPMQLLTYLLHPECVSVLLYGLHRLDKKFVQQHNNIIQEKRFFNIKGYDNSFAVYVLLRGDLIYLPQHLFSIRDNGMYLSVYHDISNLKLSKLFFERVRRYALFPIMFFYDWLYGTLHIFKSSLSISLKSLCVIFIFLKLIYDFILYIYSIVKGIIVLLLGLIKKVIRF
ncbi:MAG: glycosyltransferase family 2 protein [Microgenomates group bacterium]